MITKESTIDNMNDIRSKIVSLASSYSGVGVTHRREEFESLLGPTTGKWDLDRPFKIITVKPGIVKIQGISTCGLVAEGIWREAGIALPEFWSKYAPKLAIERSIARAKNLALKYKAVRYPASGKKPGIGDYLCVTNGGGSEHVCTVIKWETIGLKTMCTTVDGGQTDPIKSLQCVKTCYRLWRDKPMSLGDKQVAWWVDVESLPTASS